MKQSRILSVLVANLRALRRRIEAEKATTYDTLLIGLQLDGIFTDICRITGLNDDDRAITSNFNTDRKTLRSTLKERKIERVSREYYLDILEQCINNAIEDAAQLGFCTIDAEPPEASPAAAAADKTPGDDKKPPEAITGGTKKHVKLLSCLEAASRAINAAIEELEKTKENEK